MPNDPQPALSQGDIPEAASLDRAFRLHQAGDKDEAARLCEAVLSANPQDVEALHLLGVISLDRKEIDRAIGLLAKAVEVKPECASNLNDLANALVCADRLNEAVSIYQRALSLAPLSSDIHYNLGVCHYRLGDLEEAAKAFQEALKLRPELTDAHRNLAIALFWLGRHGEAEAACRRALTLAPSDAEAWLSLGHALTQQGRVEEAEGAYRRVVAIRPPFGPGHFSLGALLQDLGRLDEAIAAYRCAVEAQPDLTAAHINLGNVLRRRGRFEEALEVFRQACQLNPEAPEVFFSLGETAGLLRQFPTAIEAYRKAIQLKPDFADAYHGLGLALHSVNRPDEAVAVLRCAAQLAPERDSVHLDLAVAEEDLGHFEGALEHYERAVQINRRNGKALWGACLTLPVLYENHEQIETFRERWARGIERLLNEARNGTFGKDEAASLLTWHTNFNLHYQGLNHIDLQRRYGEFIDQLARVAFPQFHEPLRLGEGAPGERRRIGFVSDCCENHTILKLFGAWLYKLDSERCETTIFDLNGGAAACAKNAGSTLRYCGLASEPIAAVASRIREARLDVLVYLDVGISLKTQALAALRLAPVQCLAWGHPVTSGFRHIDHFLSSELMEPVGSAEHYSESLALLPNLSICYSFPKLASQTEALKEREHLPPAFLCSQSLFKLLPQYDEIYPRIALEVPDAKFWFVAHNRAPVTEQFCDRLGGAFARFGLSFKDRCSIFPKMTEGEFFQLNRRSAVILDSMLWSGGNTSLEALACDKPIVTLPGPLMRGRHTGAILQRAGMEELIARNVEDYVRIAVRLAVEKDWRIEIGRKIQTQKMLVYDDEAPVRALELFFERCCSAERRREF